MQSISDDDVRKKLFEKLRFELAVKGAFRLGRCYMAVICQGVPSLWTSDRESTAYEDALWPTYTSFGRLGPQSTCTAAI